MTPHTRHYEIRDHDLPDRPPLATAPDYSAAVAEVERLHEEFREQLDANGEGGTNIWQTLRIDELQPDQPPQQRCVSAASGFH
jgi:hypothetical protein